MKTSQQTGSAPRKTRKFTATRVAALSLCLLVMGAAVFLSSNVLTTAIAQKAASGQRTAKRIDLPHGKSRKTPSVVRHSPEAQELSQSQSNADGTITPGQIIAYPIEETTKQIMLAQANRPDGEIARRMPDMEQPDRSNLPEGPGANAAAQWPLPDKSLSTPDSSAIVTPNAPQTLGTQFDGATGPAETGAFPPDTMGAVGPTQFFVFLNGRMRTFNKTTGVADGVINADPDVFFATVITPPGAGELAFTSDPQVRFDRLSNRWFLVIIDVVVNAATGATTKANRVLIAVSDAASNGTIGVSTVWTLYQFQGDATLFTDYESLGIDANALYIGGDMFTLAGAFNSTKGFVIPKAPALVGTPLTVWAFSGLVATATGAGPFAPRGVDNYDTTNTGPAAIGYFIGVDNATFNTLMIRRVTNPGSLAPAPTISANISVATPLTTRFPVLVRHLGNTGGNNGRLDSLDDRLYAAHLRNGRLWTAHSIGVNNTGVAGATNNRNAARWYELQNVSATPTVLQSGTLFDNNATNDVNQRNYSIPAIMVSGQGHVALGVTIAGTSESINAFTTGRLVGDTLGALRNGPGGAALPGYTATATAYNPPGDPGSGSGRRWGDYSFTSLDPKDDMTMWTIQEYCNGANTYGVRAVKLIAPPPPPTNSPAPAAIQLNNPSTNVVVTGTAPAGQGYYDPGANPAAPHTTFNHISAAGPGIIVNTITYTNPTHVTLNVSTVGSTPGTKTVTITNPDGQTTTVQILVGPTAAPAAISGRITTDDGAALAGVTLDLNGGESRAITDASGYYGFASADTANFYTVTPSLPGYHFSPENRSFSLLANKTDAVFTATRDAAIRQNVIDSAEYFVRQQYIDFLGREPDQSGFNFWTNQIAQCNGDADCVQDRRVHVSAAFFMSIEFQETGGLVDGLYRTSFNRLPQYAEFTPDTATIARDVVVGRTGWEQQLASNRQAFLDAFAQRPAFQSVYGGLSNGQYVDQLLTNTRIIWAQGERDALVDGLASGSLTRAGVLGQIAGDERFTATKRNEMFVMMEYFGYLHRDPDASGYQFWLNKLNQFGGNYQQAEMVKAFIVSGEYRRRFGF
ncbi:MAG TPA: hypothetical protein DC047_13920 [Blastocatellia bacterium]|nr:hypothetical protein [Blastocatellia bacterium]